MLSLMSVLFLTMLGFWLRDASGCGDRQAKINSRCCDMCPPGERVKAFCTEDEPTICSPCGNGSFSDQYTIFDRCTKCRTCQQEYQEKCSLTTDAKCLCGFGFLCSDSMCSTCEEKKCVPGERLKRTEVSTTALLTQYLYHCELICPEQSFYDDEDQTCKPITQCSALGLVQLFPGNKTHNAVCDVHALTSLKNGKLIPVVLGISFAVFSVCFLVSFLLSVAYKWNLNRRKSKDVCELTIGQNITDFHLSKEESGHVLETKDDNNSALLLYGIERL